MSKRAEQKALEAYPRSEKYTSSQRLIINDLRDGFIQGYEQAEKDLALTWADVQLLDHLVLELVREEKEGKDWGDGKEFYTEVLTRFKQFKEDKK